MTEQFVQLIDEALAAVNGEVLDKSRAIDGLLDLRLAAGSPELVAAVDATLGTVPGKTMVTSEWWIDALKGLRIHAELENEKTAAS